MLDIVKQIAALTPFTFLNHFSRVVLTIILARIMGQEHYGSFVALLVLSEVLLLPASIGFSSSVIRLAYPFKRDNRNDLLRGLQQVYMLSILTIGLMIVAFVLAGFAYFSPQQLANEHLSYLLLIVPLGALARTQSTFLLALGKKRNALLSQQFLIEFLIIVICLSIYLSEGSLTLPILCQVFVVALIVVVVIQYLLISPIIHHNKRAFEFRRWFRQSLVALASGAGSVLVAKLDLLLVHHLLGSMAASVFYPAVVILGLMTILSNAVTTYIKPLILESELTSSTQLTTVMRIFWSVNSVVICILFLAGKPLLMLYGETQMSLGYEILVIMLVAQLLLPLRVIATNIIKLTANPLYNLYVMMFATAVTVSMAWHLHDEYQLVGITVAFSMGFILGTLIRAYIVATVLRRPLAVLFGFHPTSLSDAH